MTIASDIEDLLVEACDELRRLLTATQAASELQWHSPVTPSTLQQAIDDGSHAVEGDSRRASGHSDLTSSTALNKERLRVRSELSDTRVALLQVVSSLKGRTTMLHKAVQQHGG